MGKIPCETIFSYSSRRSRTFRVPVGFIICVLFLFTFAQAERLPVKTYTTADGLLRDQVFRIRQDSRGFLWFCTLEGISRFDGVSMTSFTVADGLPDRVVEDFLETKSGEIYIATGKGLARLNPQGERDSQKNPLFSVFLPDNPKASHIQILYEDKNKRIWVGTSDGLYKLAETSGQIKFENVPLGEPLETSGGAVSAPSPNTLSISAILETRSGAVWIGSYGGGLFRLSPDGNVRRFTTDNTDRLGDNKITDIVEDREGRLWASKRSDAFGGVCLLDAEAEDQLITRCYTEKDGLGSNWVRDMLVTNDGELWLGTVPGLCRWQSENEQSVCKTYTEQNDLCKYVTALAEDKDGNLWIGSACGVKKIARYGFTTYNTADGLDADYVNSIFENENGDLFVTTFPKNERVIGRFDSGKFSVVKSRLPASVKYHGWGWQQTVWQDSAGAWWIPTGFGLFRSPDNTSFEALAAAPLERQETGAKNTEVFRLFEDSRGDIWIATHGTSGELLRWERTRNLWHDYTAQTGFSGLRIGTAFAEDKNGNVWIGATSDHNNTALIRYRRNGEFRVLSQTEGAPSGWIQDLFLDSHGRLWLASDREGLWRIDDPNADNFEFVKYTTANGLTSNSTASVTEDEYGRIYVGTWRGVDRLTPDTGQIENFTTADGLPSGFVETAYRDRHNTLWFATEKGLAKFVPEPLRTRPAPNVLITGLRIGGVPQNVSILGASEIPQLALNSDQHQIAVDFIGLGATLGERLKYEYRFAGSDWIPTGEQTLNFANLASGDYRFEVRAQTTDRLYSLPASVVFRIATPFWQRWWFIVSAAVLMVLTVYLFYRIRLVRLLEMERIRNRIATDLHDDIGANLTRISLLSEVAKQKSENGNANLLSSIADIARESVSSMSDIVWAIAPEHDSLLDLTRRMRRHSEEIFAFRDIDLKFDASPMSELKLSVGVRRDVLLIFKEAVNNAAKHSNCSRVSIDFRYENSVLKLQITDNGKGFYENPQNDGQGLRSMKRRAATLGGKLAVNSDDRQGTTVCFELNLRKTHLI